MEEENSEVKFAFNFHPGFDLYVAVRCGQKEAFDKLEATHAEDPLICGYMAMSLVRSENSTIPKDINRARDLSKHFIPLVLEMVDRCTTSYFADALYILGFCYQEGFSLIKDMERAVYFYKEAASLGHPGASVNLSNCYDSGDGISIDKAKVFELDTFAANLGHPIALNNLGCCYLFGKGCTINHTIKIKLWKKASDLGYPMSRVNLGLTYLYGDGTRKDEAKAVECFLTAAKSGLCRAQLMLAHCYYQGSGITGSKTKAIEMGRLAAAQGNASAQHLVGCLLYNSKTRGEAMTFFQEAARGGNSDSQLFIGICYLSGNEFGIPKDVIEGVRFLRKAKAQNNIEAATKLAEVDKEYKDKLWENRKSLWMFLTCYQFIIPAPTDTGPSVNSTHEFFYIKDLCIFLSTFI